LLLLASLGLCLCECGCREKEVEGENQPVWKVEGVHPRIGTIAQTVTGEGILTPMTEATVTARVSEPIKRFYVQRGSHVRAGDVIAVLESGDLEAAAIADRGAFQAAQGAYDTAIGSTIPGEVQRAQVELDEAKRQVRIMADALDNVQTMFTRGVSSAHTVTEARLASAHAEAVYAEANGRYQDLVRRQNTTAVEIAKGQLEAARGKKLAAENQLSYAEIRSPIEGTVLDRVGAPGDTVAVGTPVATVADISSLIAKVHLGQEAAQQLSVGATALLAVPGIATPVPAKVTLISPALDPGSTTVEVWLRVSNPHGALKPGTPVRAQLQVRSVGDAVLIPTGSIQHVSGEPGDTVFVVGPDGTARRRTIQIGIQTPESTQVTGGLRADEMVVAEGGRGLADGAKVTVEADAPDR
jgi:RND family efflux transporter MFP subunit